MITQVFLTALPLATLRAMRSYVVLTTTLDPEPDTAVDDDVAYAITTATNLELDGTTDTVTIEVTGDMERGEQIVLTYYNVKVPELLASREPVDEQLTVTDDIVGSDYMANAVIEIEPTGLSTVSISTSPSSVEDASEVDVTVTYTSKIRYMVVILLGLDYRRTGDQLMFLMMNLLALLKALVLLLFLKHRVMPRGIPLRMWC